MVQTFVALLVSAWIEIDQMDTDAATLQVALLVSAWIEIFVTQLSATHWASRTPRECVD